VTGRRESRVSAAGVLRLLGIVMLMQGLAGPPGGETARAFDLDDVAAKAEQLARDPYRDPKGHMPNWLLKISYDQWRDIRFRPEKALWRDRPSPFQGQFFHPGLFYEQTVAVNVVEGERVRPVEFSPSQFDYGRNDFAAKVPEDLGYAGFRLHFRIKSRDYYDEVAVFLGASYFRAIGRDQLFGASARGLGVDTAAPSGEEFPRFREFWLLQPAPDAKDLTLYALLDGPSVAGAYRFVFEPGEQTLVSVDSRLFLRRRARKLGVAPLTSMFYFGENVVRPVEDYRPEVHDSDGLLVSFGTGEWLWRPLDNRRSVHVSGFEVRGPRGFGLMQRDRVFDHYQDLETHAELRPSVWVSPRGDWGSGRVELVEIPTDSDANDNVVAYWVPEASPEPGAPVSFSYVMSWYGEDPARPPGGRVVATRRDHGTVEGAERFVVDFAGQGLAAIAADQAPRGVVTVVGGDEAGALIEQQVVKNPATGGWRLTFQVRPRTKAPLEIRAFLAREGDTLTETWSYVILP
jgi:glucans biosynthesis protein